MDSVSFVSMWCAFVLIIVLLLGVQAGLRRGWKRALLHIGFMIVSVLCSYFLTLGTSERILQISIEINGTTTTIKDYILSLISVDLTGLDTINEFLTQLPAAIINPILFVVFTLVVYFVFHLIYLIVARIFFGTKTKDFREKGHKPYRSIGAAIGTLEGAVLLIVLVSPIIGLTQTYQEIVDYSDTVYAAEIASADYVAYAAEVEYDDSDSSSGLKTISEMISASLPSGFGDVITGVNDSILGYITSGLGTDTALFDALASFKVGGEKINIRTELVDLCNTYDEFVVVYNTFVDGYYDDVSFENLNKNIDKILTNNLFKVVVTNTLNDFLTNYDTLNARYNLDGKLGDLTLLITNLQEKSATPGFSLYDYIYEDLTTILNCLTSEGGVDFMRSIKDAEDYSLDSIIEIYTANKTYVTNAISSVFKLNIVEDGLTSMVNYASDKLTENISKLNSDLTDEELSTTLTLMSDICDIMADMELAPLIDMVTTGDIYAGIAELTDITTTFNQIGCLLDDINALPIISYEDDEGTEHNVLTDYLESVNVNLLGDTVKSGDVTKTLTTYEEFFDYLATPISLMNIYGVLDIFSSDEVSLDDIKTALVSALTSKDGGETALSDILMPFYSLNTYAKVGSKTFKSLIFDTVIDLIDEEMGDLVSIAITADANFTNYSTYSSNLTSLGEAILVLNREYTSTDVQDVNTYLDYILSGSADYYTLISDMNTGSKTDYSDNDLYSLLTIVFTNSIYSPLQSTLFTTIDKNVGNITGINPTSSYTNLSDEYKTYAATICDMLTILDQYYDESSEDTSTSTDLKTQLTVVGSLLDELKTPASNGVFFEVFENVIWYLTDDVIYNSTTYTEENNSNKYASYMKSYLGVADDNVSTGYYYISSYTTKFSGLADVLKLADSINTNLGSNLDISSDVSGFVDGIYKAFKDNCSTTDEEGNTKIDDDLASSMIATASQFGIDFDTYLLSGQLISDKASDINTAIDALVTNDDISSTLAAQIKSFLGTAS